MIWNQDGLIASGQITAFTLPMINVLGAAIVNFGSSNQIAI